MSTDKYILQIPDPCNQQWNHMLPRDNGRFCANCSKTIVDFSTLTDGQIVEFLEKNKGKLCGRFHEGQLDRVLSNPSPTGLHQSFLHKVFAGFLLLLTTRQVVQAAVKPSVISFQFADMHDVADAPKKDSVIAKKLMGIALDSINREPLAFATVFNHTKGKGCMADVDGKFEIDAAKGDTIEIKYIGYKTKSLVFTGVADKTYLLVESERTLVGDLVIINRKANLKHRIKRFFWRFYLPKIVIEKS